MRFVFFIGAIYGAFLLFISLAQAQEDHLQLIDLSEPATRHFTPRLQKGKQIDRLKTPESLSLELVQTGLGAISALATNGTGLIYAADPDSGRIWVLSDRNNDGRIDIKRALPHRFDRPTGLAIIETTLYVSDRAAIWLIEGDNSPQKLAGLKNANSTAASHPLAISPDGTVLFLGLTTKENTSNILSIDRKTGEANLINSRPDTAQLRSLFSLNKTVPWVLSDRSVGANLSQMTEMHPDYRLIAMALPRTSKNWPSEFTQNVIISQQSSDGFSVIALPAALGNVETKGHVLLSGFLSDTGRTAWGAPGALIFDAHGLLIADSFNGDLYRLSAPSAESPKVIINPESIEDETILDQPTNSLPSMVVSTITGSQIDQASGIESATTLDTGSTIMRDYKPLDIDDNEASSEPSNKNTEPN